MWLIRAQARERNVYRWAATRRRTTPTLPTDLGVVEKRRACPSNSGLSCAGHERGPG